jgi:hypothetical protein
LVVLPRRRGICASTASSMSATSGSPGAPSGIPISITRSSPACSLPGFTYSPGFAAANVAVARARTASPSTSPVEAFTPLGTSAATTVWPSIAAIASAAAPRTAPSKPVPRIASTTTTAPSSAPALNGSVSTRLAFTAASPCSSAGSASNRQRTSRHCSRSSRAATSPSPPLLPLPHTIAIGPSGAISLTSAANPAPARSIRSSEGTPRSSIAQRSMARIASAPGSATNQSVTAAPPPRRPSFPCGSARRRH